MKSFKTIRSEAEDEYIVNKSRFICQACPCETEEQALAFLKKIREKHRDATHNCYAYIIGENAGIMRFSDDGEPGGTAGMPMMEVLKARGVVNLCVVITRYFGGVLLGAGGLVRAYSHSCSLALSAAQVIVMEKSSRFLLDVPYPLWDKVHHALLDLPVQITDTQFQTSVETQLLIRLTDADAVLEKLTSLTDGRVDYLQTDEIFYPWNE